MELTSIKNEDKKKIIDKNAKEVEVMCSHVISNGIDSLSKAIPDLKHLLGTILDSVKTIQKPMGNMGLKDIETTLSEFWNTFL